MYELLAGPFEMKCEEIANLELQELFEKIAELVNSINESEYKYLRNTDHIHKISEAIKDLSIAYAELSEV